MASVRLFLREYDSQRQNETITERNVEIPAVPLNGQSILVTVNGRLRSFLVTGTYIPADGTPTIAAFVFAMAMSAPYQEAVRVGIEGDDLIVAVPHGFRRWNGEGSHGLPQWVPP